MRTALIVVIMASIAYLGWHYFGQSIGPLSSSEARAVKIGVEQKIHNQGGYLQEPISVLVEMDAKFICGWYQHTGVLNRRVAFVGLLFHGKSAFAVAATAETNTELSTVREVCAARGLTL